MLCRSERKVLLDLRKAASEIFSPRYQWLPVDNKGVWYSMEVR